LLLTAYGQRRHLRCTCLDYSPEKKLASLKIESESLLSADAPKKYDPNYDKDSDADRGSEISAPLLDHADGTKEQVSKKRRRKSGGQPPNKKPKLKSTTSDHLGEND